MDEPLRGRRSPINILYLGIAGALIGGVIDGAFGGVLIPARWPVIIGTFVGLTVGKIIVIQSFK